MVRYLPLGNGRLKISFDENYRIADFYFSEFASENHSSGGPFRHGISVDGSFRWVDSGMIRKMDYADRTLQGNIVYETEGVVVENKDTVDLYSDIYLRKVRISNNRDKTAEIRMFYQQNFSISGSFMGDTAQYIPELQGVVHYKGSRYFLASAIDRNGNAIHQYATGVESFDGKEGTWRDAEDSELSGNPVSIGSVDSVISCSVVINSGESAEFYYYLACSDELRGLTEMNREITFDGLEGMLSRTSHYWRLWLSKDPSDGSYPLSELYQKSLLIIRTHINDSGAIVASCDSEVQGLNRDGYYYVWPRDSSIAAYSMIRAGHGSAARKFYRFCASALSDDGYLHHKYRSDGRPASSWLPHVINGKQITPIQEDETALVIWSIKKYFERFHEVETVASLYQDFVKKAADFIVRFSYENGLPRESFDLWEERYGIHAYTVATSYAALKAASYLSEAFGDMDSAANYNNHAEKMSESFEKYFYSNELGRYARSIIDGVPDFTADSALSSLFLFGMRDARDPHVESTMDYILKKLWVPESGGVARYENDPYLKSSSEVGFPGNPWIITTLWAAQYFISRGDLVRGRDLIDWTAGVSNSTGVLPEQIRPSDRSHLSASPLVWSHAQLVLALADYREALLKQQGEEAHSSPVVFR